MVLFRNIKLQARSVVLKKYKYFFPLVLLYEFVCILNLCVWTFGIDQIILNKVNFFLTLIFFLFCTLIQFLVLPVLVVIIIKTGVCLTQKSSFEFKSFLSRNNILKIVILNLVPNFFPVCLSLLQSFKICFEKNIFYFLILFSLMIIRYVVDYKFLVCNYYFVAKESSIKEILISSFNATEGNFIRYIIYDLSFVLWDLSIVILFFLISLLNILHPHFKYLQILIPSGFGIMFYYRPYRVMADMFFSKNLLSNKNNH